jgi:hypothetical protein
MKYISLLLSIVFITACTSSKNNKSNLPPAYIPDDKALYDTIVYLDSVLFEGYNTCKLDRFEKYFSENIEFYHDKGGLSTSKKDIIQALKNNICGKVRRELVAGSIEVYPISGYGAIEMGSHRFHNLIENSTSRPGKFVHTWRRENGEWKITRVISLH